jgi:hypothetical protein
MATVRSFCVEFTLDKQQLPELPPGTTRFDATDWKLSGRASFEIPENAINPTSVILDRKTGGLPLLVVTWIELSPAELAEMRLQQARQGGLRV